MSQAKRVVIREWQLGCPFCGHDRFLKRKAQLNTAMAELFNLGWANRSAVCFVCEYCGYIQWFLDPDERQ